MASKKVNGILFQGGYGTYKVAGQSSNVRVTGPFIPEDGTWLVWEGPAVVQRGLTLEAALEYASLVVWAAKPSKYTFLSPRTVTDELVLADKLAQYRAQGAN